MTKLQVLNLTPHTINLCGKDGVLLEQFPPSGNIARVRGIPGEVLTDQMYFGLPVLATSSFGGVMVGTKTFREFVEDWDSVSRPTDPQSIFLVSGMVAQAIKFSFGGRARVISPDTSDAGAVRDDAGQIVGVKGCVRSF